MRRTIFAPATPPGRGGVAVIRISGPAAAGALRALAGDRLPSPRVATLTALREPGGGAPIDRGLVLWFPGPGSFTGEDVVELHVHGGRTVTGNLLEVLAELPDLRPAEPGEFTRRAFENDKLDLTEAEAIADLVDAETRAQQRQALRQLSGSLGRLYGGWASRLTNALAHLEADLDFPDEDLPDGVAAAVAPELRAVRDAITVHLDDGRRGERLRDGLEIAILGPPNAGKSSLLNALATRDVAIVSDLAGTTRDVIEVHLDLNGYPVTLADTAGLRVASDAVEVEGVRRARQRAEQADLRLILFDACGWPSPGPEVEAFLDEPESVLLVGNKIDLCPIPDKARVREIPVLPVSVATGSGIPELLERLGTFVAAQLAPRESPSLTRARHRAALEQCAEALDRAMSAPLPELAAEDARLALRALGRITGRVDVEALLDVIFRDFCIGK